MEFIDNLKADNASIHEYMFPKLQEIYTQDGMSFDPNRYYHYKIFENYLRKPGRGVGGSLLLRFSEINSESDNSRKNAVCLAAATEIMNASILMIDDLVDNSDYRKNIPTIHKLYEEVIFTDDRQYDVKNAPARTILLGMSAMCLSNLFALESFGTNEYKAMNNIQVSALNTINGLTEEMSLQYSPEYPNYSTDQLQKVYRNKAGWFDFAGPIKSGLILAEVNDHDIEGFVIAAEMLGVGFQIEDDLMGLYGNPSKTGKPNTDDISNNVYTYLVDLAHRNLPDDKLQEILKIHRKDCISQEELDKYKEILSDYGIEKLAGRDALSKIYYSLNFVKLIWKDNWNTEVLDYLESMIEYFECQIKEFAQL